MRQNIITLSLAGYPALVEQLTRLAAELNQTADNPIVTLVLFGSVARLMAGQSSDADLLALHADDASEERAATWLIHRIRASDESGGEDSAGSGGPGWHLIPIFGDAQASDLDPDFLGSISHDGVLLYQRRGSLLPRALAKLTSFAEWRDEVSVLLAALRVAAGRLSEGQTPPASHRRP